MSFFAELQRRSVVRAVLAYAALAWLIIQVVETVFPLFGLSDAAARAVVVLTVIGVVPVAAVAWAFELTPEGLRRDSEVDHDSPASRSRARRFDRFVVLLLALAVGYFAVDKFVLDPARDADELASAAEEAAAAARSEAVREAYGDRSIAVLPFVNLSADPEQSYLADGLAEELLNLLARVPELRVISRTSAFSFRGSDLDVPAIARRLGVAHVLEGSVRRSGDRIRITVQLIDAASDSHLWAETYDRTLDDIFVIQDEVAEAVVSALRIELVGDELHVTPVDPSAYALALKARQIIRLQRYDELPQAVELLEEALELEPGYVDALISLRYAHTEQIRINYATLAGTGELAARGAEVTRIEDRILALDPENPTVLIERARRREDLPKAEHLALLAATFEAALEREPGNTLAWFFGGNFAESLGRIDLAIRMGEHVVARDPLFFWGHLNLAERFQRAERFDEAFERFRLAESLNATAGAVQWKTGHALLVAGDAAGALERFQAEPGASYRLQGHAMAYHDLGRHDDASRAMEVLVEHADGWPWGIARAYAWMGRADEAFEYLELTLAREPFALQGMASNPLLEKLHDDPRWRPFLQKAWESPEQLATIEFDVTLPGTGP